MNCGVRRSNSPVSGAEARASAPLTGEFDLRTPQFITLSLYQDYEWELRAEQRI